MSLHHPSYRAVLSTQHVARSFLPSALGRLSPATSGLAMVLLLVETTESFTNAGLVTAAFGLADVVATPWRARLIDRLGPTLPLSPLGLVQAARLTVLGFASESELHPLLCLGFLPGCPPRPSGRPCGCSGLRHCRPTECGFAASVSMRWPRK